MMGSEYVDGPSQVKEQQIKQPPPYLHSHGVYSTERSVCARTCMPQGTGKEDLIPAWAQGARYRACGKQITNIFYIMQSPLHTLIIMLVPPPACVANGVGFIIPPFSGRVRNLRGWAIMSQESQFRRVRGPYPLLSIFLEDSTGNLSPMQGSLPRYLSRLELGIWWANRTLSRNHEKRWRKEVWVQPGLIPTSFLHEREQPLDAIVWFAFFTFTCQYVLEF